MFKGLLVALLALGAPAGAFAQAQPRQQQSEAPSPHWIRSTDRIASVPARTSFPLQAGSLTVSRTRDNSDAEEGTDSVLSYQSADGKLFATVYVYLPGLSHPGLAAFATERGIFAASSPPPRRTRVGLVSVGKVEGAGIRADYEGYRGNNFSSAVFAKAGRWMIKIRMTGPTDRRTEVETAMNALLAGIEFGPRNPAQGAAPVQVGDCAAGEGSVDAKLLPDPAGPDLAAHGFLAALDGGGVIARDERGERTDLPSRVPERFCLSSTLEVGQSRIPLLRAPDGPSVAVMGRTRLVAIISDAGDLLEVVHAPNLGRYWLLHHVIGATYLLGSYDGVPSDRQMRELISEAQAEGARVRVPVTFGPDGKTEIQLPSLPAAKPNTTS